MRFMFNPSNLNPKSTPKRKLITAVLKLRDQQFSVLKSSTGLWVAVFNSEKLENTPGILVFNNLLIKINSCTTSYDFIRLLVDVTRLREDQTVLHNQYNVRDINWVSAKYKNLTNIFNTTFVSVLEIEQPQEMKN